MKGSKILGVVVAACGLLVALVPTVILPVCQELIETKAGTFVPMRCHYTAQAEILVGGLLAFVGAIIFAYGHKPETRGILSAVVLALGSGVVLIPTILIGTCKNPMMDCNVGAKPALILLGALTMLLGAGGIWEARRSAQPPLTAAASGASE
jgi:hypothetical protein